MRNKNVNTSRACADSGGNGDACVLSPAAHQEGGAACRREQAAGLWQTVPRDLEHLSGSHPRQPAQQNPHHLSGPDADGDANGDGGGDGDGDGRPSQQGRGRVAPPHA